MRNIICYIILAIAARLRRETTLPLKWIAGWLHLVAFNQVAGHLSG